MDIFDRVRYGLDGCDVEEIGRSYLGVPLYATHFGSYGGRQAVFTAGIHARECYTALVLLRQIEECKKREPDIGIYFIPLVDPDGAAFFESGLSGDDGERFRDIPFLAENLSRRLVWKANAQGVDLNCNFDARFGSGALQQSVVPAPSGYTGQTPLCAPESAALAAFTERVRPVFTVSYHCMGGELYWEFYQTGARRERDRRIASAIARFTGLGLVDGELASAGGYKDWCVEKLQITAVTAELISRGVHPLKESAYADDIEKNAGLPAFVSEIYGRDNG